MAHSAVLLAGGKSSRMGCDKSALLVDGEPLWRRQLQTLRATAPTDVLISGSPDGPYRECGERVVPDGEVNCGPISGIASALEVCGTDWLLVLAVDLPGMTGDYLRGLVEQSVREARGVVPIDGSGNWEPLSAVYPKSALAVARSSLSRGQYKLADFISELELRGWIQRRTIAVEEMRLFRNWNTPDDLREP